MPLNIIPTAAEDGIVYSDAAPLTPTEADLDDPIGVTYGQEIVALVRLSLNGLVVSHSAYIVMQTELGGIWIDVAWIRWTASQGSATFVLVGGGRGAMNNAFQQTRDANATPSGNGSVQVPLGGRIRFVGKSTMAGGSSSVSGSPTVVSATITYKLTAPR